VGDQKRIVRVNSDYYLGHYLAGHKMESIGKVQPSVGQASQTERSVSFCISPVHNV